METNQNNALILLSGGIDSVTALYWSKQHFSVLSALSFHYGSKHNEREIFFAKQHCQKLKIPHKVIYLPFVNDLFKSNLLGSGQKIPEESYHTNNMKLTVVPFRNGIMLSIAAGLAESTNAQQLIIAAHGGDHAIYPDCQENFMQAMSTAINLGTYANITINRPFIDFHKKDIVKAGIDLGIDYTLTWSCYKGEDKHCGQCSTCRERKEAFAFNGINDPTEYE